MDKNNTLSRLLAVAKQIVCSRRFAAVILALSTFAMATMVSVHSRTVMVTDGVESHMVLTMHADPYKALEAAGMKMEEHDELEVSEDASTITINRAVPIEVQADGISTLLYMVNGTVKDALAKAEVTVGQYDTVNTDLSAPIAEGMSIIIDRVAYREYTVDETIAYQTNVKYTPVLRPGKTSVRQNGVNGSKTITYRETIVNGKVVETQKVGEKITKNAVTKEMLKGSDYGTPLSKAPFNIQLDSKNQPVNYQKVYTGKDCTAYSIGTRGASGMRLGVGTVAVNPNIIPYGTKLWITSADGKFVYGYAIAADTGNFAKGNRIFADLYFGSYKEACNFGIRNLNIYVIG